MAEYQYKCEKCDHSFTVALSMSDHETREHEHDIRCPKCDSNDVRHVFESFFVTTAKKS
jgi:putative FmdB family regulatory protein